MPLFQYKELSPGILKGRAARDNIYGYLYLGMKIYIICLCNFYFEHILLLLSTLNLLSPHHTLRRH